MGKVEEKVEKAEIEGFEEITKEEKQNGELSQQDLLEQIVKLTDGVLSGEVRGDAIGAYDNSGMYNIPFGTSEKNGGKKVWKECDMMPGVCSYKGEKFHTHQIDVGIRGAEYAMQAYGHVTMKQTLPHIDVIDGEKMWIAEIEFKDTIKKIEFNDFFMQPVMKSVYDYETKSQKKIFDEYGYAIAISKCMRKGILRLIPGALRAKWIKAYREGGNNPFTKESVQEFRQERKEEVKESQPEPSNNKQVDEMTVFADIINSIGQCQSLEELKNLWESSQDTIKNMEAGQMDSIKRAKDEKKSELSKVPAQTF